jgi:hypothetical protein
VQALVLQPPVAVEALSTQGEWVNYLESLQDRWNSCYGCGQTFEPDDEVRHQLWFVVTRFFFF